MTEEIDNMLQEMEETFNRTFEEENHEQKDITQPLEQHTSNPEKTLPETILREDKYQEEIPTHPNTPEPIADVSQEQPRIQEQQATQQILNKQDELFSNHQQQIDNPKLTLQMKSQSEKCLFSDKSMHVQAETAQLQDHEELISYQALTEKFQMALSRIKHAPSSSSDFAARQDNYLRKKKSDIDLLRLEREKQEKVRCSGKPLINSRSQQMLSHYVPIHSRYKEVIQEKQKKVEAGLADKKSKEAEKEEKIIREMEEHQQKIKEKHGKNLRSEKEYYAWMKEWSEVRNKKVEDIAIKRGQVSVKQSTFKPALNEKSQLMMKKVQRIPIYEQQPQLRKVQPDKNCTFRPNLTKTMKK